jgi:hypothetical protein
MQTGAARCVRHSWGRQHTRLTLQVRQPLLDFCLFFILVLSSSSRSTVAKQGCRWSPGWRAWGRNIRKRSGVLRSCRSLHQDTWRTPFSWPPPANPTWRARSSLINPCYHDAWSITDAAANRGRSRQLPRACQKPDGACSAGGARPTLSLVQANRGAGTAPPTTLGVAESTAEMDRNLRPQLRAVVVGKSQLQCSFVPVHTGYPTATP